MLSEQHQNQLNEMNELVSSLDHGSDLVDQVMKYLHAKSKSYFWVGVYVLVGNELRVGPYYGPKTDHKIIPVGKGVCGTAVAENKNQVVEDVQNLENYLACNLGTRSEIVVLVRDPDGSGKVVGQIDVDGTEVGLFSDLEGFFDQIAILIAPSMKKMQLDLINADT